MSLTPRPRLFARSRPFNRRAELYAETLLFQGQIDAMELFRGVSKVAIWPLGVLIRL